MKKILAIIAAVLLVAVGVLYLRSEWRKKNSEGVVDLCEWAEQNEKFEGIYSQIALHQDEISDIVSLCKQEDALLGYWVYKYDSIQAPFELFERQFPNRIFKVIGKPAVYEQYFDTMYTPYDGKLAGNIIGYFYEKCSDDKPKAYLVWYSTKLDSVVGNAFDQYGCSYVCYATLYTPYGNLIAEVYGESVEECVNNFCEQAVVYQETILSSIRERTK